MELPLFSCYLFVHLTPTNENRVRVRQLAGVLGIVGVRGEGIPIPEEQIEAVRTVISA